MNLSSKNRLRHTLLAVLMLSLLGSTGCKEALQFCKDNMLAEEKKALGCNASSALASLRPEMLLLLSRSNEMGIQSGQNFTCLMGDTGAVNCFGSGSDGRLGLGNTMNIGDNESVFSRGPIEMGGRVVQISTGSEHACALMDTGDVRCWGKGTDGRLGYGNERHIGNDELPMTAGSVNLGGQAVQISAGGAHTCALLTTGNVRCWGKGTDGRLGYGSESHIGNDELPFTAGDVNVGGRVVQVAAGGEHTCALLDTGNVRCWGKGADGRLGYGNENHIGNDELPHTAGDVNIGGRVLQIAAGGAHTCALLATRNVRCWGQGTDGRLGYGNERHIGNDELPFSAGDVNIGGTVSQISLGDEHSCALLNNGALRCWGKGAGGRLGYGNTRHIGNDELPSSAGDVNLGSQAVRVSAGGAHTCAILADARVLCFGQNESGQLGQSNTRTLGDNESPRMGRSVR